MTPNFSVHFIMQQGVVAHRHRFGRSPRRNPPSNSTSAASAVARSPRTDGRDSGSVRYTAVAPSPPAASSRRPCRPRIRMSALRAAMRPLLAVVQFQFIWKHRQRFLPRDFAITACARGHTCLARTRVFHSRCPVPMSRIHSLRSDGAFCNEPQFRSRHPSGHVSLRDVVSLTNMLASM